MANTPITEKQLLEELIKKLSEMSRALNMDDAVLIKRKAAGRIQLVNVSQKNMN